MRRGRPPRPSRGARRPGGVGAAKPLPDRGRDRPDGNDAGQRPTGTGKAGRAGVGPGAGKPRTAEAAAPSAKRPAPSPGKERRTADTGPDPAPEVHAHHVQHNNPVTTGPHSIAANDIKNVIIRWVMHPSARWLPLLLACAALVIAQTTDPHGPAGQYALSITLAVLAVAAGAVRVLIRKTPSVAAVGALSLVSVLATVGGWLSFQYAAAHADVDVTGQVRRAGTLPLTGRDHTVTFTLGPAGLREHRDRLRLTLAVSDYDPSAPACSYRTTATAYLMDGGAPAQEARVRSGRPLDFVLNSGTTSVQIQVTLTEQDPGQNCRTDIRATGAVLHDA